MKTKPIGRGKELPLVCKICNFTKPLFITDNDWRNHIHLNEVKRVVQRKEENKKWLKT